MSNNPAGKVVPPSFLLPISSQAHTAPGRATNGEPPGNRAPDDARSQGSAPAAAPKGPAPGLYLYPSGKWDRCWACGGTGLVYVTVTARGPCRECAYPKDALDRIAWETKNKEEA